MRPTLAWSSRLKLALLWVVLIISDSAAQLLFKSAAIRIAPASLTTAWVVTVATSWRVWSAVACLLVTFGCWMLILRGAELGKAFPVTALTLVGVVIGSWWFFGETVSPIQFAGIALIVAGVAALKPLRTQSYTERI